MNDRSDKAFLRTCIYRWHHSRARSELAALLRDVERIRRDLRHEILLIVSLPEQRAAEITLADPFLGSLPTLLRYCTEIVIDVRPQPADNGRQVH